MTNPVSLFLPNRRFAEEADTTKAAELLVGGEPCLRRPFKISLGDFLVTVTIEEEKATVSAMQNTATIRGTSGSIVLLVIKKNILTVDGGYEPTTMLVIQASNSNSNIKHLGAEVLVVVPLFRVVRSSAAVHVLSEARYVRTSGGHVRI